MRHCDKTMQRMPMGLRWNPARCEWDLEDDHYVCQVCPHTVPAPQPAGWDRCDELRARGEP